MKVVSIFKKNMKLFLIMFDILCIGIAYYFSCFLVHDASYSVSNIFIVNLLLAIVIYELVFNGFEVYKHIVKYENGKDYLVYMFACAISSAFIMISSSIVLANASVKINIVSAILIAMFVIGYRVIFRITITYFDTIKFKEEKPEKIKAKNLLIIGAGFGARDIIKTIKASMKSEYNLIGIIDDDKNKLNYNISGVFILGNRNDIPKICEKYNVDVIFFTISRIDNKDKKEILDTCQNCGVRLRLLPSTEECIKNKSLFENLRDVEIEDLLYRDTISLDNTNIAKLIENNIILITGAGGSIGSELCRQIVKYNPKKLVIFDIYENSLYDIELELKSTYSNVDIEAVVGSIRDKKRLEEIFKKYKPSLVFHAAAHKHVPLMENSPLEAIKNNVFGTFNVVNCCDKYRTNKFVLISSDKAVNPTNIMGATKRICEMIVQAKNKVSRTEYVAVRFGNVLGSNGSVVPLFKKQIAQGGPVTVTHKEITRYFMTIPEAAQLVLQAITYAKGGEIFVLDMGQPVKVYDLAVSLIRLSGFEPDVDIPIKITGLRPGEKLYEELLMAEEGLTTTNHNKIYVAKPMNLSMNELNEKLVILNEELKGENQNIEKIKKVIKKVVPTYIYEVPYKKNKKKISKQYKKQKLYILKDNVIEEINESQEELQNAKA